MPIGQFQGISSPEPVVANRPEHSDANGGNRHRHVAYWLRLSKKSGKSKIKQHSIRQSSSTDIMIQNDPEFRNIVFNFL